jgi:hypothetical protein
VTEKIVDQAAAAIVDSITMKTTGKAIADVSEERDTAPEQLIAKKQPAPASEVKRKQWMTDSPFGNLESCLEWEGTERTITATCCKTLIIEYQKLLAAGNADLAEIKSKDPYLSACKYFNTDIRQIIENMENPPRDSPEIPF